VLPYIRRALGPAQLQAERVRLELTRPIGQAVFGTASSSSRIRSKIRWGGLEPPPRGSQSRALPGELRTWGLPVGFDPTPSRLRGGRSASLSYRSGLQGRDSSQTRPEASRRRPEVNPRRAAYEAAARPLSYPAPAIPPEGFEPSRARGPRRSERRAYAFRHGGKQSGSGGNRTRIALGFNQPLYR
jgi:hypothetical protein